MESNGANEGLNRLTYFSRTKKKHNSRYHLKNFARAYNSWLMPYIRSRIYSKEFRPILCYLYTDLNCNLDCHYCYSRGRKIPGMTTKTAKDAIDWLQNVGCRVLAYMGGEPLIRKDFIIEITRYAVERGFFVYLPTNGILLDAPFIDEIGKAGVSTINLAVDSVNGFDGIPKSFDRIKPQFEYLVQQEKEHDYIAFFNINITKDNSTDVKALTEIAHEYGIATDYHINEPPLIAYDDFEGNDVFQLENENQFREIDAVIDWLVQKNLKGYTMVNSIEHLKLMKDFIRHRLAPWPCRAGELSMVIRLDGSFAPCFELYGTREDWGDIYRGPRFDPVILAERKRECSPRCLSTCNFQVNHYTQSFLYSLQWVAKHAYGRFFGVS
ncbi:radical SAM domain protein [delta proteobacterium NaphS2]|nr:radical SAM domain protein [delta proteobacterium NaphS2]